MSWPPAKKRLDKYRMACNEFLSGNFKLGEFLLGEIKSLS